MKRARLWLKLAVLSVLLAACGQPGSTAARQATPSPGGAATPGATIVATATPTAVATATPTAVPSTAAPTAVPPTATPEPTPLPALSAPVRIVIDAIGLDRQIIAVGLDANNAPVVLKHDVAWYEDSATPAGGENVVLWAHVLRFKNAPKIPAPFARVRELAPGATITLFDGEGQSRTYAVSQQIQVRPDQVEYILPQGREQLTMVSCIGDKVVIEGSVEMTKRLITIAEPLPNQ